MYSNTNAMTEYPHEITIRKVEVVEDTSTYPYTETENITDEVIQGFMDTPSTSERLTYHSMDKQLTRALYVPYTVQPPRDAKILHDGKEYQIVGDVEDQGGQHEVNRIPLSEVVS